jgi:transmembrane sensor
MYDNRFLLLLTRKLSGEASQEELEELAGMVAADPALKEEADIYARFWEQQQQEQHATTELALQKVLSQINRDAEAEYSDKEETPVRRIPVWKRLARIAAILVLVAGMGAGAYKIFISPKLSTTVQAELVQKQNAKGVKSTIELADGSKIWLNADSKVQYPALFTGNTREVYLNGEAFFDIAKNPSKPFIIHLSNGTVRVLGTSFNIKAYDGDPFVETSVATGKVAFIPKLKNSREADTIFLTPNNKVVYRVEEEKIITTATISAEDKGWTEGKMVFRSMLFKDIAVDLERNFGKKIVFKDEEVANFRLTGSFQNNTLAEILFYLSKSKAFTYTISDEEIAITR